MHSKNLSADFTNLINLHQRTALVCGASEGIGLASAILLSQMNAKVILLSRNIDKLKLAKAQLYINQHEHQILSLDLSDLKQIHQHAAYLQQQKIDIIINNAGGPSPNNTQNASIEEYLQAFNTHILASSELSKILLPHMQQQKWGRIVNIISVSAKTPVANLAVSNTIRGAMVNWAKTLSNEVAQDGICVNNVLPGYTKTQRLINVNIQRAKNLGISTDEVEQKLIASVPMHRLGEAKEVANAVAFFASDLASFITGQSLCVDGGLSAWS